jgi:hypothetical protein
MALASLFLRTYLSLPGGGIDRRTVPFSSKGEREAEMERDDRKYQ